MFAYHSLDLGQALRLYQQQGYVVVEDVLPGGLLDAAMASLPIAGGIERYNASGRVDFRKLPNLAVKSEPFRKLACHPHVARVVGALLEQAALMFRDVMVVKPAKEGAHLDYHQDSAYWDVEPKALVSAWIPMSDVSVERGCLKVIAGSQRGEVEHDLLLSEATRVPSFITRLLRRGVSLSGTGDSDKQGISVFRKAKNTLLGSMTKHLSFMAKLQDLHARVPAEEKKKEVDLPVRKGSVIFFHSLLLHASNSNRTELDRCAYIASYMGENYQFTGVGEPELLVAAAADGPVYQKARVGQAAGARA